DDQLRETKVSTKLTQCRPKSPQPGVRAPAHVTLVVPHTDKRSARWTDDGSRGSTLKHVHMIAQRSAVPAAAAAWLIQAVKYNLQPFDDRFAEPGASEISGRPELISGSRQIVFGGLTRVRSWVIV